MRQNPFFRYLFTQVAVILMVLLIFKIVPNVQTAATLAGVLFVTLPVVLMTLEYRRAELEHFEWFVVVLQFWTLFALPILGMRLANWGVPFTELSFLGISGQVLHNWSSKSYMVMMIMTGWKWFKTW